MPSEVSSLEMLFTACKVSKYGVFSGPYLDTFHAVIVEAKSVSQVIIVFENSIYSTAIKSHFFRYFLNFILAFIDGGLMKKKD